MKVVSKYDNRIYEVSQTIKIGKTADFPDGKAYLLKNENNEFWTNLPAIEFDLGKKKDSYEQMRLF